MVRPDEQLMERVRDGDREAFTTLFDRYAAPLYAFLCRMTGQPDLAEDLVRETFGRVWAHRFAYRPGSRFPAWLYAIARHSACNAIKRSSHHEVPFSECRGIEDLVDAPAAHAADSVAEAVALRQAVQAALLSLPPDHRAVVILREYDGLSYREIGQVLGLSEGHARVLACRARSALHGLLALLLGREEDPCLTG